MYRKPGFTKLVTYQYRTVAACYLPTIRSFLTICKLQLIDINLKPTLCVEVIGV